MIEFVSGGAPTPPVARASRRWVLRGAPAFGNRFPVSVHGAWHTLSDAAVVVRGRPELARYEWCAVSRRGIRYLIRGRFR